MTGTSKDQAEGRSEGTAESSLEPEYVNSVKWQIPIAFAVISCGYMLPWTTLGSLISYYKATYGAGFCVQISCAYYLPGLPVALLQTLLDSKGDRAIGSRNAYLLRGGTCFLAMVGAMTAFIWVRSRASILVLFLTLGASSWLCHGTASMLAAQIPGPAIAYLQIGFRCPELYTIAAVVVLGLGGVPSHSTLATFYGINAALISFALGAWLTLLDCKTMRAVLAAKDRSMGREAGDDLLALLRWYGCRYCAYACGGGGGGGALWSPLQPSLSSLSSGYGALEQSDGPDGDSQQDEDLGMGQGNGADEIEQGGVEGIWMVGSEASEVTVRTVEREGALHAQLLEFSEADDEPTPSPFTAGLTEGNLPAQEGKTHTQSQPQIQSYFPQHASEFATEYAEYDSEFASEYDLECDSGEWDPLCDDALLLGFRGMGGRSSTGYPKYSQNPSPFSRHSQSISEAQTQAPQKVRTRARTRTVCKLAVALVLTVWSSIFHASFFAYVGSRRPHIAQELYFVRLISDLLGRPLTFLPRPSFVQASGWLLVLSAIRACLLSVFFAYTFHPDFPKSDAFILCFEAVFSLSAGYLGVLVYEHAAKAAPSPAGRTRATSLLNLAFQFAAFTAVISSVLVSSNISEYAAD